MVKTELNIEALTDKELDDLKHRINEEYAIRRKKAKSKHAYFRDIWEIFGFDVFAETPGVETELGVLQPYVYTLKQNLIYMCDITLGNYVIEKNSDGNKTCMFKLKRVAKEVPPELDGEYKKMADELIALIRKYHKEVI